MYNVLLNSVLPSIGPFPVEVVRNQQMKYLLKFLLPHQYLDPIFQNTQDQNYLKNKIFKRLNLPGKIY